MQALEFKLNSFDVIQISLEVFKNIHYVAADIPKF